MIRIPDAPPKIAKLPDDIDRPLFSIMIPTYNCIEFLKETLQSVLTQYSGPQKMQIEVVDDCSTDGDVFALVQEVGKGRVSFYRQRTNVGSLRNFETCINRARGHYVHLLHGDDKVKDGFYKEIEFLFKQYPQAGAAFTGHLLMDETSREYEWNKRVSKVLEEPGLVPDWQRIIAQKNLLQPPAKVVKRSVYENLGSFFAVHFGEDWEMWVRIASEYPVAFSPRQLAVYRVHLNNITSKSILSGQNIKDLTKVIEIISTYLPEEDRQRIIKKTKENTSKYLAKTARKVLRMHNNPSAALVQAKAALAMHRSKDTILLVLKAYLKIVFFMFRKQNEIKAASPVKSTLNLPADELLKTLYRKRC